MQKLLRGRALYVLLAILTILLYARAMSSSGFGMDGEPAHSPEQLATSMEWWPAPIDVASFQQAVQQKPYLAVWIALCAVLGLGMVVGGVVLTVWGIGTGRMRLLWRIPKTPLPAWTFGELGRIAVLILLIAALMPFVRLAVVSWQPGWQLDHRLWMTLAMLFLDGFAVMTILVFAQGKRTSVWNAARRPRRQVPRWIRLGLRSYVAAFPWLFLLLFVIVETARALHLEPPLEPIQDLIFREHRPWVFALTLLLACGIGPLAEELFFRGVVYTAIRRKLSRWLAMLISGSLFAMIHTNLIGFLPIMLLGCLLAYLYERTGSLLTPLAVHIVHNTLLMMLAMLYRHMASV